MKINMIHMNNNMYKNLLSGGNIFSKLNIILEGLCPIFGTNIIIDDKLEMNEIRLEWEDNNINTIHI